MIHNQVPPNKSAALISSVPIDTKLTKIWRNGRSLRVCCVCIEAQQAGFVNYCFVWGDRSWPIRARLWDLLFRSAQDRKGRERCLWLHAGLLSSSITQGYCRSHLGRWRARLRDMSLTPFHAVQIITNTFRWIITKRIFTYVRRF